MNPVRRLMFLFVALAALAPQAKAADKPVATITGKTDGKLLFVQVTVNGVGPLWFCVDTGAPHTVIDPYVVQRAGLNKVGQVRPRARGRVQSRSSGLSPRP